MNEFRFDSLSLHQKASFSRPITDEMLDDFCRLSGDHNPLHMDTAYAQSRGYPHRVVHGLLAASLYSTLVGVHLPGRFALLHEIHVQFLKPVFAGDLLTIEGVISHLTPAYRRIEIRATSINQKQECTSKATLQVGLLE